MASYEVGYGKPPLSGRFRAGVSGNPKGRPKRKATPLAELIKTALNAPIDIGSGEEPRSRPIAN